MELNSTNIFFSLGCPSGAELERAHNGIATIVSNASTQKWMIPAVGCNFRVTMERQGYDALQRFTTVCPQPNPEVDQQHLSPLSFSIEMSVTIRSGGCSFMAA